MTIGEKIKYYRTQLGLSQEELGQKLLVSRQTISLWEKGQTAPTIDNLIRLKDIFGVTVDEILNCEETSQKDIDTPTETYRFTYLKDEFTELYKYSIKSAIRKISFPITILLLSIVYVCFRSTSIFFKGLLIGMLILFIISYLKGFISYRKTWKNSQTGLYEQLYECQIYNDLIKFKVYKDNEIRKAFEFKFDDIQKIYDTPKLFLLTVAGQSYFIRKSDLTEDSAFYSFINNNPSKLVYEKPIDIWEVISLILFAGSFISFFLGFTILDNIKEADSLAINNIWILFLFTPIPIASIIYGFILKKKGLAYTKNMVVGIIMTILLCIFGSFSFLFSTLQNKCSEEIQRIEQTTGIDIPEYVSISINNNSTAKQNSTGVRCLFTSDVYFNQEVVSQFEYEIDNDFKWLSFIPEYLKDIASPLGNTSAYTNIMIYNVEESTINHLPKESGTCHYITILYDAYNNYMSIVEYEVDYVK